MPTLNEIVVRRVEIRGSAPGVDDATNALERLKASLAGANDNLVKANASARANNDGWRVTGEGAISAANHLRQAAEAAYVFSPAFREVTNSLAAPALKGATVALEAVAQGIVTATNVAGAGVVRLGTAVETTFPALALLGVNLKTAGAWMEAFSPTLAGAATTILSRLLPALSLLAKGLLIVDAIRLVTQAWQLGDEKLKEYVDVSEKATKIGVSAEFFQRMGKGAEGAKTPVTDLVKLFERLNDAASPELGGNSAQKRLQSLLEAGNFKGNSGIGDLKAANSNEERFSALAKTVHDAMDAGQRLAAIDLTKTFFGPEAAANLAKDSAYLDKIKASIDEVAAKELIPDSAINNAVELQNRLDAAEKILSQRWHPIQDLLTQLGIRMREVWVDIVEAIAKGVDAIFRLGEATVKAMAPAMEFLQTAAGLLAKVAPYVVAALPGGQLAGATLSALGGKGSEADQDSARARLGSGLRNPNAVAAARDYANSVYDSVRKDTSKAPSSVGETITAYDRATESVLKYIEVTKASAATVGQSVAEQEKAKVVAQLTAAAMKDGTPITAALRTEMEKLGDKAGAAAQALEKAKIASDIKFNRDTALLSSEDVQIAQQLRYSYDSVAEALRSVDAQAIRTNNAFKQMGAAIEGNLTTGLADILDGTKSVGQGFADMSKMVLRALEEMIIKIMIVQPLMNSLQSAVGGDGGILGLLGLGSGAVNANGSIAGAIGPTSVGGAPLVGLHSGGIVGSEATFTRYVHPAYFDHAPRFHTGGIAGDEVPIIARKGEGVFTPGQMAALGGGQSSQGVHVSVGVSVDDDGKIQAYVKSASQASTARGIQQFVESPQFVDHVGGALPRARTRRLGR